MLTSWKIKNVEEFYDLHQKIAAKTATTADIDRAKTLSIELKLDNTIGHAKSAYEQLFSPNLGYLGAYAARGNRASRYGKPWASDDAPVDISSIDVTKLNIEKFLETAKLYDGDVDGLSDSASSSTVKEGEERFVIGASYTGTRGVSIVEVSGALGSFVHGKRVNWTDGDIWVTQKKGKMYKTDLETDSFDYKLTAKNILVDRSSETIKLETKASDSLFVTNSAEDLLNTSVSAGRVHNFSYSKAALSLVATSAAFSVVASAEQTNMSIGASLNTTLTISPAILAYNLGLFRFAIDSTIVTAQISQNSFFNVARNSVSAYETLTEKMKLNVSASDIEAKNTLVQLGKTSLSAAEVGLSFFRGQTRASQLELKNEKVSMSTSKVGIAIEESQATLEKHRAQVIQNAFTTWT